MRDYSFGSYLTSLRKKAGLSQEDLAKCLGITNKAVSKWENGVSKPTIDKIQGLCHYLDCSAEELINCQTDNNTKTISKIVITGGPCAGKSTALVKIQDHFEKLGYGVVFIPETATELILSGVSPTTLNKMYDFENSIINLQIAKEKAYVEAVKQLKADKIILVCDRGCLDCKAYMTPKEFERAIKSLKLSEATLRDSYDAVFHLVSAANGAEEYYTLSNNQARQETIEEAKEKDNKTLNAWTGHPHLRIIDNSTDFETKINRLISEIALFLGEPMPYEIERKFLIKMPNLDTLKKNNCTMVEIIQTYLNSPKGTEARVRQRGHDNVYTYTYTTKKNISPLKRVEIEERLSESEYLSKLMSADTNKHQIRKNRYCLVYKNQYFEIDIYPFWKDKAIMEIELSHEDQDIIFPEFIEVIEEVTNSPEYRNSALANKNNG